MRAPDPNQPPPAPPWATPWHRPIFDSVVEQRTRRDDRVPRSMVAAIATAALALGLILGRMF